MYNSAPMFPNIVNKDAIGHFLNALAEGQEPLATYLGVALTKAITKEPEFFRPLEFYPESPPPWLTREVFERGQFVVFDPALTQGSRDMFRHIKDWIKAAIVSEDTWTMGLDDKGRPKRVLQIGSLARAHAMADKEMKKKANALRSQFANAGAAFEEDEQNGHIKTIKTYADGSRIVRLLTSHALDIESAQLGHCIGEGAYDDNLLSNGHAYYSLRSPLNKAHATFEVIDGVVEQFKGKQNAPPVSPYMEMGQEFIFEQKLKITESPSHTGLLFKDGVYYDVRTLPPGFTWDEDIDLVGTKWLKHLPDNLSAGGDLGLRDCTGLTRLPDNLSVGGGLSLENCTGLTRLPDNLCVGGGLSLENCTGLVRLPDNLSVGGGLSLQGCTGLKRLPDNLSVGRFLSLHGCTGLTRLPDNLSVGGGLYLRGCTGLTQLPEKLDVEGTIHWRGKEFKDVEKFRKAFELENPPQKKASVSVPPTMSPPSLN